MKTSISKYIELFFFNITPFKIGFVLTCILLWPLFFAPYFTHHDDVQVIRLHQIDKCFKDFQIPCRWVPDLGGLYGYPIFNYYAPLPYYFGELVYMLSNNLIFSSKVMFGVSFVLSYIFMYLFAREFWGKLGGSLSAIFYTFVPYHALDFYVRGAMGEMWGLAFLPLVFYALTRLLKYPNIKYLILSSVSTAFLITSHNLSTMMFMPVILFWILIFSIKKGSKKFLLYSFLSLLLGVMLAGFYLFPMFFEKNLVHVETTTYGYFSFTEHFKGLRKLFLDTSWGWGASVREVPGGERDGISFQIGWVHLFCWVLVLVLFIRKQMRGEDTGILIKFSTAVILLSIFLIHPKSDPVWKFIEPMKYFQFPWRFLMLIAFFISFISGSIFTASSLDKIRKAAWIILIILVVGINFFHFRPEKFIYTTDEKLLSGENWDRQIKRSIFDYLPIYAKEPPAELADKRYEILTGDGQVTDYRQGSNWFLFKIDIERHTIIRLSQYYFPDWRIFVNGKQALFEYKNNSLGLMTLILGKGNYSVEGKLYDTPVRSISNVVTVGAFILTIILMLTQIKGFRKWFSYYLKAVN